MPTSPNPTATATAQDSSLTFEQLLAAHAKASEELQQLRAIEAEHQRARASLELSTYALRERVKELNCLYSISEIAERSGLSSDAAIQLIVDAIPAAWQYPRVTCSRIVIDGKTFQSDGFRRAGDAQSQAVTVSGICIGFVEVRYLEPCPSSFEGPFLKEERSLINAIAGRVGEMVERRRAEAAIVASLEKNRALLAAIPDLIVQLGHDGVLFDYHGGDYSEFDSCLKALLGRDLGELFGEPGLFSKLETSGAATVQKSSINGTAQVLQRKVTFQGKRHDFEIRLVTTSGDNTLGILRDITQRSRLEREILEVSGREQRRIGRELHDGLCQHLAGLGFLAQALARRVPASENALARDADELAHLIGEAISLAKGLTRGLIPVRLESEGLLSALLELTNNASRLFGVDCRVEEPFTVAPTDATVLLHLYRIAQESLNNAIKHGSATLVTISVAEDLPWASLTIQDNGKGFCVESRVDSGLGLGIMRYRALMIGGSLSVESEEQRGTSVICRFPTTGQI